MNSLPFTLMTSLLCAQLAQEPARVQTFEAVPRSVKADEPIVLHWAATGTERIRLEPLDQDFPPVGQVTYVPRERTVFWIHASNTWGGQSIPLVVEIIPEGFNDGSSPPPAPISLDPGGIWIQLAALADPRAAETLGKAVLRLTGARVARFEIEAPRHPGQTLQRLRIGPYPSVREARRHLRSLQTKLQSLHLKPIVAVN
jgi:hypothetical protein